MAPSSYQRIARRIGLGILQRVWPNMAARIAFEQFLTPTPVPANATQQAVLDTARLTTIAHGDDRLRGYVWENDGPTVLLAHGWEGSAASMTGMVEPLLAQGYRVVAFDGPAHGISIAKQTNLVDYGKALQAVVADVGSVYAIIAHSFGGASTMMTAADGLPVERLVIIAAPARLTDMIQAYCRRWGLSARVAREFSRLTRQRIGKPAEYFALETFAHRIKQRGLVVHDRRDPLVAFSASEALVAHWKHAELLATEGLGHRRICSHASVLDEIVRFLGQKVPVALALPY